MRINRLIGVAATCLVVSTVSACSDDASSDAGGNASGSFGECDLTGEAGRL